MFVDNPFPDPAPIHKEFRQWEPQEWELFRITLNDMLEVVEKSGQQLFRQIADCTPKVPIYPFAHNRTLLFGPTQVVMSESFIHANFHDPGDFEVALSQFGIPINSIPMSEGRFVWKGTGWMRCLGLHVEQEGVGILVDSDFVCRKFEGAQCIFHELAHAYGMEEIPATQVQIAFVKVLLDYCETRYKPSVSRILKKAERTLTLLQA